MKRIIRLPGTLVPKALCFTADVFLYFFRHGISKLPRPITVKLCHMITIWVRFIMQVQKFRGPSPPKKLGAKNMQNSARFHTTSDFDREYLRNGQDIQNRKEMYTPEIPPAFNEKSPVNFGPLTTENGR